jgi:hypothetical protein
MPSILRLPLEKRFFDMTSPESKVEDYREITGYWARRLLEVDEETDGHIWAELLEDLANPNRRHEDVYECLSFYGVRFKKFDQNEITLGYPSKNDRTRIKTFEHKGIEIRTGRAEWGAELHKVYFVIMHGAIITPSH